MPLRERSPGDEPASAIAGSDGPSTIVVVPSCDTSAVVLCIRNT